MFFSIFTISSGYPFCLITFHSPFRQTLSKAFLYSMLWMYSSLPNSSHFSINRLNVKIWSIVLLPGLKPACASKRISCVFCLTRWSVIEEKTLVVWHNRVIPLRRVLPKSKPKVFFCCKSKSCSQISPSNLACSYSNQCWTVCVKTIHFTWHVYTHYLVMLGQTKLRQKYCNFT